MNSQELKSFCCELMVKVLEKGMVKPSSRRHILNMLQNGGGDLFQGELDARFKNYCFSFHKSSEALNNLEFYPSGKNWNEDHYLKIFGEYLCFKFGDALSELDQIHVAYCCGVYANLVQEIKDYFYKNLDEIKEFASDLEVKSAADSYALFLLEFRATPCAVKDLKEQEKEIQREIYLKRQKGEIADRKTVSMEWISKHAKKWRHHRYLILAYLIHQQSNLFHWEGDPDIKPV